jgi:hypothetical protein
MVNCGYEQQIKRLKTNNRITLTIPCEIQKPTAKRRGIRQGNGTAGFSAKEKRHGSVEAKLEKTSV